MKVKVKSKYKNVKLPKLSVPRVKVDKDEGKWIAIVGAGLLLVGLALYVPTFSSNSVHAITKI